VCTVVIDAFSPRLDSCGRWPIICAPAADGGTEQGPGRRVSAGPAWGSLIIIRIAGLPICLWRLHQA